MRARTSCCWSTRSHVMAMASREIGLAAGEPPTTRGYPPSTFALLPELVERAGRGTSGAASRPITRFSSRATIPNEPVADTDARSARWPHLVVAEARRPRGHYPAIDVLQSISRLHEPRHAGDEQQKAAAQMVRRLLAAYTEHEDLISIGAYRQAARNPACRRSDCRAGFDPEVLAQPGRREPSGRTSAKQSRLSLPPSAKQFTPQNAPPQATGKPQPAPIVAPTTVGAVVDHKRSDRHE